MKAYQDKETGLWKWGSNGAPIYQTEKEAKKAGLNKLIDKLFDIQEKRSKLLNS